MLHTVYQHHQLFQFPCKPIVDYFITVGTFLRDFSCYSWAFCLRFTNNVCVFDVESVSVICVCISVIHHFLQRWVCSVEECMYHYISINNHEVYNIPHWWRLFIVGALHSSVPVIYYTRNSIDPLALYCCCFSTNFIYALCDMLVAKVFIHRLRADSTVVLHLLVNCQRFYRASAYCCWCAILI